MKLASAALQYVVVALVVASGARGAQAGVDAGLSEEEVISESLFVDGPRQGHQPLHLRHRSEDDLPSVTSDTWDEGRARQLRYQRKRRHNAYVMTSSPANSAEASPRASTTLPASSNSISSLQSRTNNGTFVLFDTGELGKRRRRHNPAYVMTTSSPANSAEASPRASTILPASSNSISSLQSRTNNGTFVLFSTGELGFLLTGQTTPQPLGFFIDETRNRELYLPNGNSDGTRQYFGIFWNGADGFVNGAGTAVSFEISGTTTTTTTTTTTNSTNTTSTGGGGGGGGTVINTGGGTIVISDFDSNSNNDSGPETDSGPDETSSNDVAGSGCQQYGSSNRSSSSSSSSSSRSSSSSSSSSTSSSRNRRYGKGKGGKRKGKGGYRWSRELKKSKSGKGKGKGKGKGSYSSSSSSNNSNSNSHSHSNAHYVYYHHGQPSDDSEPCG